jgi:hypothetical protein
MLIRKMHPLSLTHLHLEGLLWTLDSELEIALRGKGFDRFFKISEIGR